MATKPALKLVQLDKALPIPLGDDPGPLDRAIQEFLQAKAGKSLKTVQGYQSVLRLFRAYVGDASKSPKGDPHAWPPTSENINGFLNDCKRRGLKESSVFAYHKCLKIWLAWLVKRGRLTSNPIEDAETPPQPQLIPRAPRQPELHRLFSYLIKKADKGKGKWLDVRSLALWSLALDTGCRVGELAALSIDDLALRKDHGTALVRRTKTHRERTVVFREDTAKDLRRWLKARTRLPLPAKADALFVGYCRGKWSGLTTWGIRQELKELCQKARIPHLTPRQFRNACAVYMLRNHADVLDVQKQLGHRRLSTTERYVLVDDEGRVERHSVTTPRGKI